MDSPLWNPTPMMPLKTPVLSGVVDERANPMSILFTEALATLNVSWM